MVYTITNDSLKLEFQTNGDYNLYYSNKPKTSPNYLKKEVKKIINKNFQLLLTAETSITPYYTLVVQFRESIKDKGGLINYKHYSGKFLVLSKEICINNYCYVFSLIYNTDQPKDLFEDEKSNEEELDFIFSSIK